MSNTALIRTNGRSAIGAAPPNARPSSERHATLEFADNALLPLLVGEHDRYLARIEQRCGVRIAARGNRISITGGAGGVDTAETALRRMWQRLERGQPLGMGEVDAALALADASADAGTPRLPMGDLPAIRTRKGAIEPRTPAQTGYIDLLARHEMVFGVGPAGTGKTYLAVAQGVALLLAQKVDRIVLSRPAVEAGERLGFLPGDMKEKVDPYLRPLYDALHDMLPADQVARRIASGEIEIAPLAFMRGRTLHHSYCILDEAQNTTAAQMKMFLTRMGEGSRMVVTGDPTQVDLPAGTRSGLVEGLSILENVPGIGVCRFMEGDVVRHPLVARIVAAYARADEAAGGDGRRRTRERDGTGK